MRSARSLSLAVSLVLVLPTAVTTWPLVAYAQARKPIREQLPLEARGHWDAAVALAAKKNWDGA